MATKPAVAQTDGNTYSDEDGWVEVPTETQILFPEDGDEFVGVFQGWSSTENKNIPQAHFMNDEMGAGFINVGASLKQQLKDVKPGTQTRIRRMGTRDTGQATPMVLFKVWTRK